MAAAVAALIALAVTGCVAPPSPFDGERHARDALPAVVAPMLTTADRSTSRYQGEAAGRALYLVRGTGGFQFCLAYTDGTEARSGGSCGGGEWLRVTLDDGAEFEVQLHGFAETPRPGETAVSRWVRQVASGHAG